ncbi:MULTISPECIES: hypothetical protein [Cryobacterium]|nr:MULTISPECIES: hypothetical protein [Cryobacterium]TFC71280.1 hypothetical protein E3T21_08180 [Cryobacterium sp. TMB3-15]TFC56612.1 hypothetical protein E3O60_17755 [Cryobacterium sp. TMB1-7]TFC73973.1 hypothetical protein E3T22_15365 [Cryobacterium sp. TMB3-10]TFC88774.1 hypothetical protein E3T19_09530 [Cryobacterium sp. TMT4-31]TFD37889.1 hypothetical protein E3T58_18255 [Cryobacterium sp. TMB3-12]
MMTTSSPALPSSRMRAARVVLVVVGALGLAFGGYLMVDTVALRRLPGVALWIGAAIVLHDAVISPLVFGLGVLTRRAGHRLAGAIIVTVQAAIVLGSLMTLIVLPAIAAQGLGPKNPTILPLDYARNLGLFWLTLAVASALISVWLYVRTRRANQRPSRIQS